METTRQGYGVGTLLFVAVLAAGLAVPATLYFSGHGLIADAGHPGTPSRPGEGADGQAPKKDAPIYQCPMHPAIIQDHPGNCPICGMKLLQVAQAAPVTAEGAAATHGDHASPHAPAHPMPPGLAAVDIDPARQQLIGLTTAEARVGPVGGAWRTVGRVTLDETRIRRTNLKVSGFVERIFVGFVGKKVRRGDPLFTLYSPELLAAQEEYLLALKMKGALARVGAPGSENGPTDADGLIAAARRKLLLWDVPEAELDRIARTGLPTKTLTFYSPISGVVTRKDVVEGMRLDAGAMPYEIVDLSTLWVLADVYESELRFVKEKMAATLTLNAYPGRMFQGEVAFIDPLMDARSRTVKVRVSFLNPTGELRPEMFGDIVLQSEPHDGLRIPRDALIDSGTETLVFVAVGDGKFQPRLVTLGPSAEHDAEQVEVLTGLSAGELVVTRANFLIDSESRLRASLAEMTGGAQIPGDAKPPESARVLPEPGKTGADIEAHPAGHGR